MSTVDRVEVTPSREDIARARKAVARFRGKKSTGGVRSRRLPAVDVPTAVYEAIGALLEEISEGHSVVLEKGDAVDLEEEVTTTEGARLLRMSRPTFINLLEDGHIPYRMVGTHRRVRRGDVLTYRESNGVTVPTPLTKEAKLASLRRQAAIIHEATRDS